MTYASLPKTTKAAPVQDAAFAEITKLPAKT